MADLSSDPRALSELLTQNSADSLVVVDLDHRCRLWNGAMAALTGTRTEDALGKPIAALLPQVGPTGQMLYAGIEEALARAATGEPVVQQGALRVMPDGTRRHYDRLYKPLRDLRGTIVALVMIVRDATARHEVEDALRTREEQVRIAVESAGVGLWSWDLRTDTVEWEDTLCGIFGLAAGTAPAGRGAYVALIHPDDRARSMGRIRAGWRRGTGRTSTGSSAPTTASSAGSCPQATLVRDIALGAVLDVTERRQRPSEPSSRRSSRPWGNSPPASRTTSTTC